MVKHVWSVLAEDVIIDKDTNNITVVNVLEQIQLPPPPEPDRPVYYGAAYSIVSFWHRADFEHGVRLKGRIVLCTPGGSKSEPVEFDIDLENTERTRTILKSFGLPAAENGYYFFKVEARSIDGADWVEMASIPLRVDIKAFEGSSAGSLRVLPFAIQRAQDGNASDK